MKFTPLLFIIVTLFVCSGFADASAGRITLLHMEEAPPSLLKDGVNSSLVCFGEDWKTAVPSTEARVKTLRDLSPSAFYSVEGHEGEDCLDPKRLSSEALIVYRDLLADIRRFSSTVVTPLKLVDEKNPPDPGEGMLPQENELKLPPVETKLVASPTPTKSFLFRGSIDDPTMIPMRNQGRSVYRKVLRAEVFILPATAYVISHFLKAGPGVSNWSADPWKDAGKNFVSHLSQLPVLDHDAWKTNNIDHPFSGNNYYNMLRTQGESPLISSAFTFGVSTFQFEYGFESMFEPPSTQDIVKTWILGSAAGEGLYQLSGYLRDRYSYIIQGKGLPSIGMKILLVVINPSDVLNNGFKRRHRVPTN